MSTESTWTAILLEPPTCGHSRDCISRSQWLTCGGGRPPAPGGQSGNMMVRSGVLHWHEGEGLDILQFPLMKMSVTDWSTGGVNQSEPLEEHGKFLQKNMRILQQSHKHNIVVQRSVFKNPFTESCCTRIQTPSFVIFPFLFQVYKKVFIIQSVLIRIIQRECEKLIIYWSNCSYKMVFKTMPSTLSTAPGLSLQLVLLKVCSMIPFMHLLNSHTHIHSLHRVILDSCTYGIGFPFMQRVPKPGLFTKVSTTWATSAFSGRSLL